MNLESIKTQSNTCCCCSLRMASKIGVKECLDEVAKDMAYRILDEDRSVMHLSGT